MNFPTEKRSYSPPDRVSRLSKWQVVGKYSTLAVWILLVGSLVAWATDAGTFIESMGIPYYPVWGGSRGPGPVQWLVPFWFGL